MRCVRVLLVIMFGVFFCFGCAQSLIVIGVGGLLIAGLMAIWLGVFIRYWVGMGVFLVYVGGLIVLFCYFIIIMPNQRFRFKLLGFGSGVLIVMVTLFIRLVGDSYDLVRFRIRVSPIRVGGLYELENVTVLLLLGVLLLLTLVGVVELIEIGYGPLRPFSSGLAWFYEP